MAMANEYVRPTFEGMTDGALLVMRIRMLAAAKVERRAPAEGHLAAGDVAALIKVVLEERGMHVLI